MKWMIMVRELTNFDEFISFADSIFWALVIPRPHHDTIHCLPSENISVFIIKIFVKKYQDLSCMLLLPAVV